MRPRERELAARLEDGLQSFDRQRRRLPGIRASNKRNTFVEQLVESIRRVKFIEVLRRQKLSEHRADPNHELFDPLRAAILQKDRGNIEEAFWLVFMFIHFGKHARGGWRYVREIYGRLGNGGRWDWTSTSTRPAAFRGWLRAHQDVLRRSQQPGGFGNHRKYESLDADSSNGTGAVIESYVRWVKPPRTHHELIRHAYQQMQGDRRKTFDDLYQSMAAVKRFGRTARFDYLTMLGKLDLAPITPGSPYLDGSTGPLRGAKLLFESDARTATLDTWLVELDQELNVGMQVLEDALCNWQKSPQKFERFRG